MKKIILAGIILVAFLSGALCEGLFIWRNHECILERIEVTPEETNTTQEYTIQKVSLPIITIPAVKIDPFQDKKFSLKFDSTRAIADIRKDDFGKGTSRKILVYHHEGGKRIDSDRLEKTVRAVIQRMPNLKTTPELVALLMETMETETGCGSEKLETGIKKWRNYGIAQFRPDTATETLNWLKKVRTDVHDQVQSFYNEDEDLIWNLSHNVPFSIAMMAQYYWRRVPDLYAHIQTKEKRAQVWKSEYNSSKGLGTVQCYLDRNKK